MKRDEDRMRHRVPPTQTRLGVVAEDELDGIFVPTVQGSTQSAELRRSLLGRTSTCTWCVADFAATIDLLPGLPEPQYPLTGLVSPLAPRAKLAVSLSLILPAVPP